MKLHKDIDNIAEKDKAEALKIINKLKYGDRVFGNPAEALKETLKRKEEELANIENDKDKLDFLSNDGDILADIAKIKAGIKGEETLAEYFERIVKYDKELQDIIVFASLSDPTQNEIGDELGYIADSDFIAVYGNHVLILDAKNIITSPEIPIYLMGNELVAAGGKTLLELHPSINIWRNIFKRYNVSYFSISGCVVIINNKGACIWKNDEWYNSDVKPLHIADLVSFLHQWIDGKKPETDLSLLLSLSKMQVKKNNVAAEKIRNQMRRFNI